MSPFKPIVSAEEFPVSATLYVTYLKCPQQALARLRGVYPAPSKALLRGSLAHRIFARHLVEGPIPDAEFVQVCKVEVGTHLSRQMTSLALKASEFRQITAEVTELYETFKLLPVEGFVDAEVDVGSRPVQGVVIRGRVDAVFRDEDGVRIADWKTGAYLDDAEAQLEFYAMAWWHTEGSVPATLEAVSLKTGEKRVSKPGDDDVQTTESRVAEMITILRGAMDGRVELSRRAGPHCSWCPLLEECDEGRVALEILG